VPPNYFSSKGCREHERLRNTALDNPSEAESEVVDKTGHEVSMWYACFKLINCYFPSLLQTCKIKDIKLQMFF